MLVWAQISYVGQGRVERARQVMAPPTGRPWQLPLPRAQENHRHGHPHHQLHGATAGSRDVPVGSTPPRNVEILILENQSAIS